jgi:cytochrome c oxidase subunit III
MTTFEEQKKKSAKPLLWVSMVSMSMVFAGLTSAYVVRKAEGNWLDFDFPIWFYLSTLFIIVSSLTIIKAKKSIQQNKMETAVKFIKVTFFLALAFALSQFLTWNTLTSQGVYFTGPGSNASGSFLYVLMLLHFFHLVGGVVALLVSWFKTVRGRYSPENTLGFELTAIFWHFLDFLWLYLFLFLLYIH